MGIHDDNVTAADIAAIVADGTGEGLQLEFKRQVDTGSGREWAADVTAMANTAGGVILIGVAEEDGRANEVVGVDASEVDALTQQLHSIIRDRVEPALPGLEITGVDVDGKVVLVVRIARSWAAPHLVRSGVRWQVCRRNSAGKYAVTDVLELRGLFAQAEDVAERIRRWHQDRVLAAQTGSAPASLQGGAFLLVSMRSMATTPGAPPPSDVTEIASSSSFNKSVSPVHATSWGRRPNLEGVAVTSTEGTGYVQLHRDGSVEVADTTALAGVASRQVVLGGELAGTLLDAAYTGLQAAGLAQQTLPVVVQMTVHGVEGATFRGQPSNRSTLMSTHPELRQDHITLPSVVVSEWPEEWDDVARALRPALDVLWNAGGYEQCLYFDEDGNWLGPSRTP